MTRLSTATPLPMSPTTSHFGSSEICGKVTQLKGRCQEETADGVNSFSVVKQRYCFSWAPGITFLSGAESCCSSSGWGMGLRGNI